MWFDWRALCAKAPIVGAPHMHSNMKMTEQGKIARAQLEKAAQQLESIYGIKSEFWNGAPMQLAAFKSILEVLTKDNGTVKKDAEILALLKDGKKQSELFDKWRKSIPSWFACNVSQGRQDMGIVATKGKARTQVVFKQFDLSS